MVSQSGGASSAENVAVLRSGMMSLNIREVRVLDQFCSAAQRQGRRCAGDDASQRSRPRQRVRKSAFLLDQKIGASEALPFCLIETFSAIDVIRPTTDEMMLHPDIPHSIARNQDHIRARIPRAHGRVKHPVYQYSSSITRAFRSVPCILITPFVLKHSQDSQGVLFSDVQSARLAGAQRFTTSRRLCLRDLVLMIRSAAGDYPRSVITRPVVRLLKFLRKDDC